MIYVTGDTHGDFSHVEQFINRNRTGLDDVLIILGDSGINYWVYKNTPDQPKYYEEYNCRTLKETLSQWPITIFCVHGNHEARAEMVEMYEQEERFGGKVWVQQQYPNILFAQDGEIYSFNNKEYMVIGGAYSIDKEFRLRMNQIGDIRYKWFPEEQPDDTIKNKVETGLEEKNWKIHGILSHTAPLSYEPRELFLHGFDQSKVDITTEEWLDTIEDKLNYDIWYFGHYHGEKEIDKMRMLFHQIEELM